VAHLRKIELVLAGADVTNLIGTEWGILMDILILLCLKYSVLNMRIFKWRNE